MTSKSPLPAQKSLLAELSAMIAGTPGEFELQHHLFNWATFMSAFFMMLFVPLDLANQRFLIALLDFSMSFFFGVIFIFSRTKNRRYVWLYIFSIFVFIGVEWFPLQGSNGPTAFSLTLIVLVISVVFKGKIRNITTASYLTIITTLFLLEYNYPEYLYRFPNRGDELIYEHAVAMIACVLTYSVMRIMFSYYAYEKKLRQKEAKSHDSILALTQQCASAVNLLSTELDAGIILIDQQKNTIMDANQAAQTLLGKDKQAIIGISWSYFLPVGSLSKSKSQEAILDTPQKSTLLTGDGKKTPFMKTTMLTNINGKSIRIETFWPIAPINQIVKDLEKIS